jgi:hypothetical protein
MSFNKQILNINKPNKEEKKSNESKLFFLEKFKTDKKNKSKLFQLENILDKKILFKIKLNFPMKNINLNYFNKNNRIKFNNIVNTTKSNDNFYIMNYKNKNKPKIILPYVDLPNINKSSFTQPKKKFLKSRKNLKKISLTDLFKDKHYDINIPKENKNLNRNFHAKSEWNLFNEKEKEKNNDDIIFEKLIFNKNFIKISDINSDRHKTNQSNKERIKSGAERLEEIHRQKIKDCNKLIKKMAKETEHKKNLMNKCLKLMRENFENSIEFNTKFI